MIKVIISGERIKSTLAGVIIENVYYRDLSPQKQAIYNGPLTGFLVSSIKISTSSTYDISDRSQGVLVYGP